MKKVNIRKRFILTIFLTIILILLFAPLFSDNLIAGMWLSSFHNKAARVDIQNAADENVAVKVTEVQSPSWHNVEYQKRRKNTAVINGTISSKWRKFTVEFEAVNDGNITILWRGPYFVFNAKQYPVLVDFRSMEVNGKQIFKDRKTCKFDNPLKYVITVKKGEIIKLSFEARKHHWRFSDLRRFYSMNWLLFFSVIILAFLLSYKSIQYVSKFKIMEHNSRIDIVFVVAFVVLLFVPMSHISTVTKSVQENRMLAKYPSLLDKTLNLNYGKQFEKWFNDRFFGREYLLNAYYTWNYNINKYKRNNLAIKSPDDTIFNLNLIKYFLKPISEENMKIISENIAKLQRFAKKNNIDLYLLIPPAKEDIYLYKLKDVYVNIDKNNSIIYPLNDYILKHNNIELIYPRNLYFNDYTDLTHNKTDHHWSEFGAFLGYQELLKRIKEKHPDIKILQKEDFEFLYNEKPRRGGFKNLFDRPFYTGSDCRRLGLKSLCPLHDKYKYFNHKDRENLQVKRGPIDMSRITHYDKGFPKRVTLLGNSYGGFLMSFLPYTFSDVQMLRVNNQERGVSNVYDMKRFEKHILDFHTDILIFYLASSYALNFKDLYKD
ncbi:MAG: hypothetical protein IJ778_02860 [Alphaproteobacteria bacterium]|nr:hypothetical protein [Alphaproteobacteria bacterium]